MVVDGGIRVRELSGEARRLAIKKLGDKARNLIMGARDKKERLAKRKERKTSIRPRKCKTPRSALDADLVDYAEKHTPRLPLDKTELKVCCLVLDPGTSSCFYCSQLTIVCE